MKQIFFQLLVCCLLYNQCFGFMLVGSGISVASCTENTVASCSTIDDGGSLYTGYQRAQSLQVTTSGTLSKVRAYIHGDAMEPGDSGIFSVRIGTTTDLSVSYLSSGSVTISDGQTGWVSVDMSGSQTLNTSTTYYIMFDWSEISGDKIDLGFSYSASCLTTGEMYYAFSGWDLTGATTGFDLAIEVITCD
jgi:hypothetical protein